MPATIGSINVDLTMGVQPYATAWGRAQNVTRQATAGIRREVGLAQRSVSGFTAASSGRTFRPYAIIAASRAFESAADRATLLRGVMLSLTSVAGGFAAALTSNVILRYADTFTSVHNQMRVVSKDSADLAAQFAAVKDIADRSRASLQGTATLYSRLAKAAPTRSLNEIARVTETIQKALQLGGATTQEALSSAIQLSQGIASNRLGGEELRAILETPLGLELARGLGVTIGKFREMGHAGELTADVLFGAFNKISDSIDNKFAKSVRTVDQATVYFDNTLTATIGNLDKTWGATRALGDGIVGLANNLETLIPILSTIGGLLAATFASRALVGGAGRIGVGFADQIKMAREESSRLGGELSALKNRRAELIQLLVNERGVLAQRHAAILAADNAVVKSRAVTAFNRQREAVLTLGRELKQVGAGIAKIAPDAEKAARASKGLGAAFGTLKHAGNGLLGFFGGPWGVALTGAITLLGYLGLQAQKEAQRVANARQIIQRELEEIGSLEPEGGEAKKSLIEGRITATEKDLENVVAQIEDARDRLKNLFNIEIGGARIGLEFLAAPNREIARILDRIRELSDEFTSGKIDIVDYSAELNKLAAALFESDSDAKKFAESVRQAALDIKGGEESVDSLTKKLERLRDEIRDPILIQIQTTFAAAGSVDAPADLRKSLEERAKGIVNTKKLVDEIEREIAVLELEAAGNKVAAETQRILNKEIKDGNTINKEAIEALVARKIALEEEISSNKKSGAEQRRVNRELERTKDIIDKILREGEGADLSDIDRAVIQNLKNIKNAETAIRSYIEAARSGDFSGVPQDIIDVRQAVLTVEAANAYRALVQQYGTGAQITKQVAEYQEVLNKIIEDFPGSADIAKKAAVDFFLTFQQNQWINDLSNAFGDFAKSAILDFENINDAAAGFLNRLAEIVLELLVIQPLVDALRASIAGGFSGGGGGIIGAIGKFIGGLFGAAKGGLVKAAEGGRIVGPGTGTSDSILARVSNGEYIVNAAATAKYKPLLDMLNGGKGIRLPQYNLGGMVSHKATSIATAMRERGDAGVKVDVGVSVDDKGRLQAYVKQVSAETAAAGIQAYDRKALPSRVRSITGTAFRRGDI